MPDECDTNITEIRDGGEEEKEAVVEDSRSRNSTNGHRRLET